MDIIVKKRRTIMSEKLTCPICGEPTRVYMGNARKDRLCRNHAKMLKNGEIKVCEKCGKWHNTDETCECENASHKNEKEETHCVVCGENSYGKPQCKNCYYETKDFIDSLDKNKKIRDYYYNLKERILIIKSLEETQKQCNHITICGHPRR